MKAKQLKEILSKVNDDSNVVVTDYDGKGIAISGVYINPPMVWLETKQLFPDDWYDENGEEVLWIKGKKVVRTIPESETFDLSLTNRDLFKDGEEHVHTCYFRDGYAVCKDIPGLTLTYPMLEQLTDAQIEAIDEYCGGRITDSGCITPGDVCLLYGEVEYDGIMDTTNGHDKNLVDEINGLWLAYTDSFEQILCALYARDIDEITDSDSFLIPSWLETEEYKKGEDTGEWGDYNKMALRDMRTNWKVYADNYLEHIANDGDLEAVCSFVRYLNLLDILD